MHPLARSTRVFDASSRIRTLVAPLAVACCVSSAVMPIVGCGSGGGGGGTETPPVAIGALTLTTIAILPSGGAHTPTFALSPPADIHRLMVLDKIGIVRVIRDDTLRARPFLDLQSKVTAGAGNEQGLLGVAFSPGYTTDHVFYVCYNALDWSVTVARYHVSADPESADASSAQVIISVPHGSYSNHNGGMIAFGPDGFLYFSTGDGGSQGDPTGTGQNVNDLPGSILRLDVSGGGAGYATPAGNPFPDASHPAGRPEVWCYGLRNPWRFSFDRSNGDLYIGDVGQDTYEEIDVATAANGGGRGVNYGWNVMEGDSCYSPASGCNTSGKQRPALSYEHGAINPSTNCVIGGYVYRGSAMPGLAGTYFYADNGGRWLRSFKFIGGVATTQKQWIADVGDPVNAFGEDARGELYLCCYHGAIKRLGP